MRTGTGAFQAVQGQRPGASEEGFVLDMEVCRKTFEAFDRDRSGYLDLDELGRLAEALWNTFHPEGPKLDQESRQVIWPFPTPLIRGEKLADKCLQWFGG